MVVLYRKYTSEVRHRQAGHDVVVQPDAVVDPQTSQTDEVFEQQSQTVGRKDVAVSYPQAGQPFAGTQRAQTAVQRTVQRRQGLVRAFRYRERLE